MRRPLLLLTTLLFASCAVGPDYEEPDAEFAAAYKSAGFKAPQPAGSWWSLFGDAELSRLIKKGEADNPGARPHSRATTLHAQLSVCRGLMPTPLLLALPTPAAKATAATPTSPSAPTTTTAPR